MNLDAHQPPFTDFVKVPYAFSMQGFVIVLCTRLLFGWLASRLPARRAIHVSTRDALAQG